MYVYTIIRPKPSKFRNLCQLPYTFHYFKENFNVLCQFFQKQITFALLFAYHEKNLRLLCFVFTKQIFCLALLFLPFFVCVTRSEDRRVESRYSVTAKLKNCHVQKLMKNWHINFYIHLPKFFRVS